MPAAERRLLLSIHDVSPRHEREVDALLGLLEPHARDRLALLVVPDFWNEAPIAAGTPFATRLRGWADRGFEIFLHGWSHRDDSSHSGAGARFKARHMTAGEGEFLGLSSVEAGRRIARGRALLEDIIGSPVAGFVAPAWLYGDGARAALEQARMPLAEDHWRVWAPDRGSRELARSPVITWASRSWPRRASSLLVAAGARSLPMPQLMRLAVHPGDTRHANLRASIAKTVARLASTHRPSRYAELLAG
ncbi:DUF2334 domain-containing protein [Sphingomonas ginkgonis]|uniref:DUF2334 domain-containing protein n=1 Tax=Sphingomonas ginkgonis TaxID=2315330 RepID=A0A3R9YL78_9SPHN|nr:polysaccharide deacetylase family protein [Sphingomonas ginkgonis]RST30050.1 DUF2334 domain-containing protein [Sphingomonas ginkgonis]